jgi:ubiquinone/menaquinone biosynthesis C-methylase UbiE
MEPDSDGAAKWSSAFASSSAAGMQAYEDALVGPVFIPWGEYLLDALRVVPGERLLDVATGPGTLARIAAARLGPTGYVLGTDLSDSMLAIAVAKGDVREGSGIEYRRSPAMPLDAPAGSFDVVCCQHGLQFFPDRHGAMAEMHRAARNGGRLGLAIWAGIELCPPFAALRDAINRVMGVEAAERYADGPWGFYAPSELAEMVTNAGFTDVWVEDVHRPVRFEVGARQLDQSLAASGLAAEIADLPLDKRVALTSAVSDNLRPLTDASGAVASYLTSQIVLATAS